MIKKITEEDFRMVEKHENMDNELDNGIGEFDPVELPKEPIASDDEGSMGFLAADEEA